MSTEQPSVQILLGQWRRAAEAPVPAAPAEAGVPATIRPEQPPAFPAATGDGVPDYEILGELGRGGMGVVYKARQVKLGRVVALKMIVDNYQAAGPAALARFRTEAEAIARLQHPNIVQIHEVGEQDGRPYISLEYCGGGSLEAALGDRPIDPRESAALVEVLARAMGAAHRARVVHRDLKPGNVLLADDGTPKVSDFGLARKLDETGQTQPGAVMGSPQYMPPEQARGQTDALGPAVDIYALGAVLYRCLTGRPPFLGQTVYDTLAQVIADDPVPPSRLNRRVPRDLETVCLKCLHKLPAGRYATAADLADDLRRFLDRRPVLARPLGRAGRLLKWARRSPFQAFSAAAGVVALAAALAALYGAALAARSDSRARRLEVVELRRQEEVRARAAGLYTQAEMAAQAGSWAAVERDSAAALGLLQGEPALEDFPLREPAARLLERARGQLADDRVRSEARGRLDRLQARHGEAVVFASGFTGLDAADGLRRTRRAVAEGLALFGVSAERGGAAEVDRRFFTPAEAARIAERCHELLLLEADALSRPVLGEPKEKLRSRLRLALVRIDRADRLMPSRASLLRRARLLEALGDGGAAAAKAASGKPARLAADHFLDGLDRYREEKYTAAAEALSQVLLEQPDHYGAEYLLALCRLQQRQYQAGREGLTRCLQMRPAFAWPRLPRGYASVELGEWAEARADFDAVLADPPDEVAAYVARVNRGVLGMRRGHWAAAVTDLRAAAALRPAAPAAYINLALVHRQRAEVAPLQHGLLRLAPHGTFAVLAVDAHQRQARAEAVAVLDEAVRRCPADARLHHERGRLHLLLGRARPARDDFARAVGLAVTRGKAGTLADDLTELGQLLYRERRHEEAVRAYQMALKVRPAGAAAWRLLARPLLALKRHEEAGDALDRFIATVPVAPGKKPTAEQARTLAEALKVRGLVHAEQAQAFRERAELHQRNQDQRPALECYTQSLRLVRDPETLSLRGWTYLMLNAADLALADFDEALRLRPRHADARVGRANALARQGRPADAGREAEAAVRAAPDDARVLYNAARAHAEAAAARHEPRPRADAQRGERRAADLLGRVLAKMPADQRAAFWKKYVQAERAFDAIRRSGALATPTAHEERPSR